MAHCYKPVCLRCGCRHRGLCVFLRASADTFPSVHLTVATNLHNRPKKPGRWTPKKSWIWLPLSKRRGLCTSRYVRSSSKSLLRCQWSVLIFLFWVSSTPSWGGVSLSVYESVISMPWLVLSWLECCPASEAVGPLSSQGMCPWRFSSGMTNRCFSISLSPVSLLKSLSFTV